ncbi:hypothetical protein [Massilia agri]|uniref:DUF3147 family protein n=1 Tax=Massilia agri TaxID=1886785 RepID=A0ABT2AQQ2_9BURK|nr:hypothetical protein [Massilia agri]MCS0598520.1 hypothetical protein [Massilia agri]
MHEKRVGKAYLRELVSSIALYMVLLVAAIRWGRPMEEGALRTLVLLSPMIGFFAALWVIARHFGRIDEYQRMRMLENVALAAALTAGLTFSYGFLETAGYPRLSMFTVWCVLCGSVGVVGILRKLLDR